jgi:hypothetical protein
MGVQVLDLTHFVHQAASLAKPSQTAPKRPRFATSQNVPQRAPIALRVAPHNTHLRPQDTQRLPMDAFGQVSDWSLYGRPG